MNAPDRNALLMQASVDLALAARARGEHIDFRALRDALKAHDDPLNADLETQQFINAGDAQLHLETLRWVLCLCQSVMQGCTDDSRQYAGQQTLIALIDERRRVAEWIGERIEAAIYGEPEEEEEEAHDEDLDRPLTPQDIEDAMSIARQQAERDARFHREQV